MDENENFYNIFSSENETFIIFSSDEDISNSLPKEDDFYSDDYEQV